MSYLRYLCLFAHSGVQYILCFVFVLFFYILCTISCQFLWIVHLRLPLWCSPAFIKGVTFLILMQIAFIANTGSIPLLVDN